MISFLCDGFAEIFFEAEDGQKLSHLPCNKNKEKRAGTKRLLIYYFTFFAQELWWKWISGLERNEFDDNTIKTHTFMLG